MADAGVPILLRGRAAAPWRRAPRGSDASASGDTERAFLAFGGVVPGSSQRAAGSPSAPRSPPRRETRPTSSSPTSASRRSSTRSSKAARCGCRCARPSRSSSAATWRDRVHADREPGHRHTPAQRSSAAAWIAARLTGTPARARTVALVALVGAQLGQTVAASGRAPGRRRRPPDAQLTAGTGCGGGGPTYSALGRIKRLSLACSRMWDVHPMTRLDAKVGVNISRGTPHVSITIPA